MVVQKVCNIQAHYCNQLMNCRKIAVVGYVHAQCGSFKLWYESGICELSLCRAFMWKMLVVGHVARGKQTDISEQPPAALKKA